MDELKCRTCLKVTSKRNSLALSRLCFFEKTIREAIIMLVPDMASTLVDEDIICRTCFNTVKSTMKFIERCFEVELINANENERKEFEDSEYDNDITDFVDKKAELEIVLTRTLTCINSDHNYYKKIQTESSVFNSSASVNDLNMIDDLDSLVFLPSSLLNTYSRIKNNTSVTPNCENVIVPDESLMESSVSTHNIDLEFISEDCSLLVKDEFEDDIVVEACDLMVESVICSEDLKSINTASHKEDIAIVNTFSDKKDIFSCSTCSETFSTEIDYCKHNKIHPPFTCNQCGKGYHVKKSYTSHMAKHKSTYAVICEICGKSFPCKSNLNVHKRWLHKDERLYMCDICPKTFKIQIGLNMHMNIVHKKAEQHQCQECGEFFRDKHVWRKHHRLVHLRLKPHRCNVCGCVFGRKDYLRGHMRMHTGEPKPQTVNPKQDSDKSVACKICGKTRSFQHIKAHTRSHFKSYKCTYCPLTFKYPISRKRHEKTHAGNIQV